MSVSSSTDSRSADRSHGSHGSQKSKDSSESSQSSKKSSKPEPSSDAHNVQISNEGRAASKGADAS